MAVPDDLRREARAVYKKLKPNIQDMYRNEQCPMCGAHLTNRQLNRVIIEGVPPVCLKDYKYMQGKLEQLAPLFEQLSLS